VSRADDVVLEVRDLRKAFGGVRAVDGCTFAVRRGTIAALIGPNGSGKTTTFDLITGLREPDAGVVLHRGENLVGLRPHQIFRRGITRTFQVTRVYREMTVLENMLSAAPLGVPGREARARAAALLALVDLTAFRGEYAGRLSYGQQKLLEFARALMPDPELLLLDEPAGGVNRTLLQHLLDHVHRLRAAGKTILLIEHDMTVVMAHCEWVVVMDHGATIAAGPPAAIREDPRVIEAYFGRRPAERGA